MHWMLAASVSLLLIACAATPSEQRPVVTVPAQPAPPPISSTALASSALAPNVAPPVVPFKCDGGTRFDVNHRPYCGWLEPTSWEQAEQRCVVNGGHLMSLDTQPTSGGLHRVLGSPLDLGVALGRAAWIALEKSKTGKKEWRWASGAATEPVTATSWNTGEPNNFDGNEGCGEWLTANGRWNDTRCDLALPYLCESRSDKLVCKNARSFTVGETQYCLNPVEKTHAEAKRACVADKGVLAAPKTADENEGLRKAMGARFAAPRMWIGLTDAGEDHTWRWTSGARYGFSAWLPGEPNDYNQEDCVELHADTWRWNDFDCGKALPSVCEGPAPPPGPLGGPDTPPASSSVPGTH